MTAAPADVATVAALSRWPDYSQPVHLEANGGVYRHQASACSSNNGRGDGGTQFPDSTGAGCWVAASFVPITTSLFMIDGTGETDVSRQLQPRSDAGRRRVDIPIVTLGLTVTLFRKVDDALSEEDQMVFHRVSFDPLRTILPFGLDGRAITPDSAKAALGDDTAGGRSADLARGDTRVSYFLPEDARVVQLTFHPAMTGIANMPVFRLGGEIPYRDVDRLFGSARRGIHVTL